MTEKTSNHRHDVKRNISSVLAGIENFSNKMPADDVYSLRILEEMRNDCHKALKAFEALIKKKELTQSQGE